MQYFTYALYCPPLIYRLFCNSRSPGHAHTKYFRQSEPKLFKRDLFFWQFPISTTFKMKIIYLLASLAAYSPLNEEANQAVPSIENIYVGIHHERTWCFPCWFTRLSTPALPRHWATHRKPFFAALIRSIVLPVYTKVLLNWRALTMWVLDNVTFGIF
jgi:magnesium-transporting ATPase (P-type)